MSAFKKILVATADESLRLLCSEALSMKGYVADSSTDAPGMLKRLRDSAYDLIISDVESPGLDEAGLYARIIREFPFLKKRILFIGDVLKDTVFFEEFKNIRYLARPFKISELVNTVDKLTSKPGVSGLKIPQKRKEGRFKWNGVCSLVENGRRISVKAEDISINGAKIICHEKRLSPDSSVSIFIDKLSLGREAKVVWSETGGSGVMAGLKFSEPVPASSIIMFACSSKGSIFN